MWFGVVPRMDTKRTFVYTRLDCLLENMIFILGSIVHIIWGLMYDHSGSTIIFNMIMIRILILYPKIMTKMSEVSIWIC
jgi:hypothetical protein